MIAIDECSSKYDNWCVFVEESIYLAAMLESMVNLAAALAVALIYVIPTKLSEKSELILASVFFLIGSTIEAESADLSNLGGLYMLFIGRGVFGMGVGFCMHSLPSYISEISPPKLRGTLVGMIELAITFGILLGPSINSFHFFFILLTCLIQVMHWGNSSNNLSFLGIILSSLEHFSDL
jgi:MFS family permease